MKRQLSLFLAIIIIFLMTACGSSNSDSAIISEDDSAPRTFSEGQNLSDSESESFNDTTAIELSSNSSGENSNDNTTERMIIHKADLYINVKDLTKTQVTLEEKVKKHGGYIVESNVNRIEDKYLSGKMIIRIPEDHFLPFLAATEEIAADVVEKHITGQDVTEDYVDLSSRLKSKKVVEDRLLSFMENAKKTKDLLTISDDLAQIQEDIELIVGKMNFLENQASYSTIDISMSEEKVVVPEIDSSTLDTWEKTKKQLTTSINTLLLVGSSLVIFFIGNIPIIGLLAIIGFVVFLIVRRRFKKG